MSIDVTMRIHAIEDVLKAVVKDVFEVTVIDQEEYLEFRDVLEGMDVDPIRLNLNDLAKDIERALP